MTLQRFTWPGTGVKFWAAHFSRLIPGKAGFRDGVAREATKTMIGFLRGKIAEVGPDNVLLDVGGVGFEVKVGPGLRSSAEVSGRARETFLWTYAHYSQEGPSLFGFGSRQDLEAFKLLLSVSGVGPRTALNVVSEFPPPEIYERILARDVAALGGVRGVGKKMAERIVVDLRDRIKKMAEAAASPRAAAAAAAGRRRSAAPAACSAESTETSRAFAPGGSEDALAAVEQALKALGYGRAEVEAALARVGEQLGLGVPAGGDEGKRRDVCRGGEAALEPEELLRAALKVIGGGATVGLTTGRGRRER